MLCEAGVVATRFRLLPTRYWDDQRRNMPLTQTWSHSTYSRLVNLPHGVHRVRTKGVISNLPPQKFLNHILMCSFTHTTAFRHGCIHIKPKAQAGFHLFKFHLKDVFTQVEQFPNHVPAEAPQAWARSLNNCARYLILTNSTSRINHGISSLALQLLVGLFFMNLPVWLDFVSLFMTCL